MDDKKMAKMEAEHAARQETKRNASYEEMARLTAEEDGLSPKKI